MFERFCTVCSEKTVFSQKPPFHCPHCEAPYPPELFSAKTVELDDLPSQIDDISAEKLSETKNLSQQITKTLDPAIATAPSEAMTVLTDSHPIISKTVSDQETVESAQLTPGEYFGKYQIIEKIAQGGMGAVFKVFHPILHQRFALKILLSGQNVSEHQLARFHQEAKSCSRIRHKHIVSVHDVGEVNGIHYLTMDLIEGSDLSKVLYKKSFDPKEATILLKKICEALVYAHAENILHRDLKPGNILVDKNGEPYVTDFGLAKDISKTDHLTQEGAILGTPAYMPPEQATGELQKVGPASDVYSLGAIFYEVLTGRCPLMGETSIDLFHKILNVEPEPIRKINPKIPKDLETICLKCLAKDPKDRYLQMKELLVDLTNYLEGRPIKARPATFLERAWKLINRHKIFSTTVFVFLVLLWVALLNLWRISQEKNRLLEIQLQINNLFSKAEKLEQDPQADIRMVRQLYNQALALDWDHHRTYLNFARFLSGRGLHQEAIQTLKNGLDRYSDWSEGYRELALLYQHTQQLKEYRETIEKFYQLAIHVEGSVEDLFLKAYQASQENKVDEAISLYNDVLKKNPAMMEARYNRSQLLIKKELFFEAQRDLEWVLKEQPNLVLPLLSRAKVFLNLSPPDTEQARQDLTHILQMNVSLPEAWLLLLQTYQLDSNLDGMLQTLEQGLKSLPSHPLLLQEKGRLLFQAEQFPEAVECFEEALRKDPKLWEIHYFLAQIFMQQERFEKALESTHNVVSSCPKNDPLIFEVQSLRVFLLCYLGHRESFVALKSFSEQHPPYTKLPEEHLVFFMQKALSYREETLFEEISKALLEKRPAHVFTNALIARKANYAGIESQNFLEKAKKSAQGKIKESLWMIRFYLEEKQIEAAEVLLAPLQKALPNHPLVLKVVAEVFFAKRQFEEAKEAIQRALEYKKNWLEALSFSGVIACAQGNADGLLLIEQSIQQGGIAYKKYLGQGLLLLQRWDEGWKQFSVSSDYFFEEFGLLAAQFAFHKKEQTQAIALIDEVLKTHPNSFQSLILKTKYLMQQQPNEAKKTLLFAKQLRVNDPEVAFLWRELNQE